MIMWIIGLSGAGKSTLAQAVVDTVRRRAVPNVVLIDGDVLRSVWGDALGHSMEERKKNADRLCRLCAWLDSQKIHAVCAILSMFEESREWNRRHLTQYHEVFIDAPLDDLARRDVKGLYRKALAGEIAIPGVNMDFPTPMRPDLVIQNNGSREDLLGYAPALADRICASF
ncbi:adenylyl-sulfate kinase [Betaproteobacteria bacterium]|nr:adenylyl-sulfate kinase [Betaproteobacteria bacterium]